MRYLYIVLSAIAITVFYYGMSEVRPTIIDSDIYRNIYEFNAIGLTDYNLREPIYWLAGKALVEIIGDPWRAIAALDAVAFLCLIAATRWRFLPAVAVIGLLLSPLVVLGLCNIHRQFIGFAVWMLIVSRLSGTKIDARWILHVIPFLIHNSLGILSAVYFLALAITHRNWRVLVAAVIGGTFAAILFGNAIASFFREGTETNTGLLPYLIWASSVGAILFVYFRSITITHWFLFGGVAVSTLLFQVSGGSSGSRFFLMVVTAAAFWMFDSERLREPKLGAIVIRIALALALLSPTLTSSFSRDILLSAYYRIPYGAAR